MVVGGGIDQVSEDFLPGPAAFACAERCGFFGDGGEPRRGVAEDFGERHLSTTLARPVLFALSAARTTSRCSPGARPARSRIKRSRMESITPSAVSIGTQLAASSEYSERRNGDAASTASNSTWALPPA